MSTLEKIENAVVEGYKKVEETVIGGYKKIEAGFVEKHLAKEGETVEDVKNRLAKEQEERTEKAREHVHVEVELPNASEIVKKNLEASKNAGKR